MHRYKLILEYDGRPYVGWQRQENGPSIQAALEAAAQRLCGAPVTAFAAGRTDAGVHALGMCVHIDLPKAYSADAVRDALNQHMGKTNPVAILQADEVSEEFHARFSCVGRAYEYRIINRRAPLTLDEGRAWRIPVSLEVDVMHQAAQVLIGQHDFTTFRASACQAASPVKTLNEVSVSRHGGDVIVRCAARSFLHNQVRSIVGTLVEVGKGKWKARDVGSALAAKDRAACGQVAPADGLYFVRADYEF